MIDVIAPLSSALERTKQILFRPFHFEKWVALAFASFLVQPFKSGISAGGWNPNSAAYRYYRIDPTHIEHFLLNPLVIAGCILIFAFILAMWLVLSWLSARGQFMLIDNIVQNRGKIVEPWNRFAHQANRLWIFNLAVGLCVLVFIMLLLSPLMVMIIMNLNGTSVMVIPLIIYGLFAFCIYIPFALFIGFTMVFMPPIMYRNGVGPWVAFRMATGLILKDPIGLLSMVLLFLGLALAFGAAIMVLMVCTLCLAACLLAIPFVSSVVLLPITVFFYCYVFDVLAQYGPEYNVWLGSPLTMNRIQ